MVIKERPIITCLLNSSSQKNSNIVVSPVSYPENHWLLVSYLERLAEIRELMPNWGLPELVMPSFEEAMRKSERSFLKVMPTLFEEFSRSEECGIPVICYVGEI